MHVVPKVILLILVSVVISIHGGDMTKAAKKWSDLRIKNLRAMLETEPAEFKWVIENEIKWEMARQGRL